MKYMPEASVPKQQRDLSAHDLAWFEFLRECLRIESKKVKMSLPWCAECEDRSHYGKRHRANICGFEDHMCPGANLLPSVSGYGYAEPVVHTHPQLFCPRAAAQIEGHHGGNDRANTTEPRREAVDELPGFPVHVRTRPLFP